MTSHEQLALNHRVVTSLTWTARCKGFGAGALPQLQDFRVNFCFTHQPETSP